MRRLALIGLALLSGCTLGPNYKDPPGTPLPPRFSEAPPAAQPVGDPREWWKALHDPELDRLIGLALAGNLDLRTRVAQIAEARAQVREARAALYPTVDFQPSVNRIDLSKNSGFSSLAQSFGGGGAGGTTGGTMGGAGGGKTGPAQGVGGIGSGFTTFALALDANWEIDIFGGNRRALQAARARGEAAEWNARDLQVSVAAEVANDYVTLRSLQAQIAIDRQELQRQRDELRILGARRTVGLSGELPVRQQALQLVNVASQLPQLDARARVQVHALGVLTGEAPSAYAAELTPMPLVALPPAVPAGVPSELLRRRPDIRAAERQLAAANADIGVAVADLYPKFNTTGMVELISTALRTLFQKDSFQDMIAGQVTAPLFDGGRRRAVVREREAQRAEAFFTYKKTILVAVQETEDGLANYNAERARNIELRRGVSDAERAVRLARAQYNAGLVDFTTVLDAQGSLLNNRNAVAQSDAQALTNLALLYKALGGGWGTDLPSAATPELPRK